MRVLVGASGLGVSVFRGCIYRVVLLAFKVCGKGKCTKASFGRLSYVETTLLRKAPTRVVSGATGVLY